MCGNIEDRHLTDSPVAGGLASAAQSFHCSTRYGILISPTLPKTMTILRQGYHYLAHHVYETA